jgi:hypothetical protein
VPGDPVATNVHVPVIDPPLTVHVIGVLGTIVPLIATDVSVPAKPLPVTVTVTPVGPRAWLSLIEGVVTVNVPLAVSAGTVPTSAPAAVTVVPLVPEGTENVHANFPPLAVSEPLVQLDIDTLSNVRVIVVDPVYPVPVTTTDSPTTPLVGVSVIVGVVIVKVAVAVSPLPPTWFPTAVIV